MSRRDLACDQCDGYADGTVNWRDDDGQVPEAQDDLDAEPYELTQEEYAEHMASTEQSS